MRYGALCVAVMMIGALSGGAGNTPADDAPEVEEMAEDVP